MKVKKYYMTIKRWFIKILNFISMPLYMKCYVKYLSQAGVKFRGGMRIYRSFLPV